MIGEYLRHVGSEAQEGSHDADLGWPKASRVSVYLAEQHTPSEATEAAADGLTEAHHVAGVEDLAVVRHHNREGETEGGVAGILGEHLIPLLTLVPHRLPW